MFFFQIWELKGVYLCIFEDEKQGEVVCQFFVDVQVMLVWIIDEKWFKLCVVIGFWFVNCDGDDICLFIDEICDMLLVMLYMLCQQVVKCDGCLNVVMLDFVVFKGYCDYVGGFVVMIGVEEQGIVDRFKVVYDDFLVILVQVLVDRFVEVLVEMMYEWVCKIYWGYFDEDFVFDELIGEFYFGICFVFGYLVQFDYMEKVMLFDLLDVIVVIGVELIEFMVMWFGVLVLGLYIGYLDVYYFGVVKVEYDQVLDYVVCKGMIVVQVECWLVLILNYILQVVVVVE